MMNVEMEVKIMAFDGITVAALVAEIDDNLKGGRINKIA